MLAALEKKTKRAGKSVLLLLRREVRGGLRMQQRNFD
jgi:hypothetical protein